MEINDLEKKVEDGAKFRINFEKRTLYINGKQIDVSDAEQDFSFEKLENLYRMYQHSVPGERDDSRKNYFIALKEEELSDDDMLFGERRQIAKFRLELYVLLAIVSGALTWDESWGKWFWQSESNRPLVILRSWVEP